MSTLEVAAQFDQISEVYDSTREPLDPATVGALEQALAQRGARRVLEVGVGTGRIAVPLTEHGVELTGVDPSKGMLAHARRKGLPRLVRGSAYRLPFADGAFDAALFVHVLHVLDDPERALAEAVRVGRSGAFAVVHDRSADDARDGGVGEPRRLVLAELRAMGYEISGHGGPAHAERRLLERCPPDVLLQLSDREVTQPLARSLDSFARRANRHVLHVPDDVLARAVAKARDEVGDREVTYRRVESLANWSHAPETPLRGASGT